MSSGYYPSEYMAEFVAKQSEAKAKTGPQPLLSPAALAVLVIALFCILLFCCWMDRLF